ncbi:hypothetical protein M6KS0526p2_2741 [Staphylococcus aureus]|nr:hypothetical protein M6KS0526p2_2741 [Staphylococcus aureus]
MERLKQLLDAGIIDYLLYIILLYCLGLLCVKTLLLIFSIYKDRNKTKNPNSFLTFGRVYNVEDGLVYSYIIDLFDSTGTILKELYLNVSNTQTITITHPNLSGP